ncbi:MAG TPA: RcpC/CpaB family pilus assembly protein [Candidatus Nanopelagicaceae bacterium]|nr:RcpC/CpaB family pilus assembly protein [Candidatus Nanopelagicaceae bacterium]
MPPSFFKPFQLIAQLANDSDRAGINRAFAFFSIRRRAIAAILAVAGAFILLGATLNRGDGVGASVKTLVASNEIVSGSVISPNDVILRDLPIHLIADGALHETSDAVGQIAVGAIRRGEVITDARVVAPSLLSDSGLVAIAITLTDSANAQLVHAGDHVDVLASQSGAVADDGSTPARVVASNVEVLSTTTPETGGGVVVLAVTQSDARAIAGANDRITLVLLGL